MRTTTLTVTGAALASVVLLGPAATAQAAEHHGHAAKVADRKAANKAERVADRRADRKAEKAHKPPQDTTTTASPGTADPIAAPHRSTRGSTQPTGRGVVSCGVTADRAGSSFTVHNGCDTPQTVTVSIQAQPGPWHVGLCQAGGCHLLTRYDVTVEPGTHTITVPTTGACFVQVDVKWDGRLIRSNHYVNECKPPVTPPTVHPRPPIITPPVKHHRPVTHRPSAHIDGHKKPAQLAFTGPAQYAVIGGTAAVFLVVGGGLILLTRGPARYTKAAKEAQR